MSLHSCKHLFFWDFWVIAAFISFIINPRQFSWSFSFPHVYSLVPLHLNEVVRL
uniref:Uncharacterized protein n=1 Tax=Rhizophora mucronata TaxID=61149 RepID=A0A2P2P4K0_RHIMU